MKHTTPARFRRHSPEAYSEPTWAPPPPTFPDVRIAHAPLVVREKKCGAGCKESHTSAAESKTLNVAASEGATSPNEGGTTEPLEGAMSTPPPHLPPLRRSS
jgi:hypothetical protein